MTDDATPTPTQAPVQPMLRVADVRKAIDTYTQAGATKIMEFPGPDADMLVHGMVAFGESVVHLGPVDFEGMDESPDYDPDYEAAIRKGPRGVGVVLYVSVDDVDAQYARCKKAGFDVLGAPKDQFYGDRTFNAIDPDGYVWSFAQTVKEMTPDEMAEAMRQSQTMA